METLLVKGKTYHIMGENLKCMYKNDLSKNYVSKRLLYGWTLHEACKAPRHYRLNDYRDVQKRERLKQSKMKNEQYKKLKHRDDHPWLYDGTPQLHPRSKYVAGLMKNDIFPKVVK
ncbi:SA1788 family PVL leukocidin-associated protein [Staphylococcus sp. 50Mo3-1]|uniref:SA1788 family PVL leukocidin-associated protein n=1 Tax=Staphylococcus sp. 50Mo3-2 TaxID=3135642 RepID=UPI0033F32035